MPIRVTLLLGCFLLAGCYSNHPIGPAEDAVFDERLLGRWLMPSGEGEGESDGVVVVVARFDEREYVAVPEEEVDARDMIRFWITEIDGQRFVNAQSLDRDPDERDYMFARVTMRGADEVVLEVPDLDAVPHVVGSSVDLAGLFRRAATDPAFYAAEPKVVRRLAPK